MVSNRSRYGSESTTEDEAADLEYLPNMDYSPNYQVKSSRKPTRTPKCFTKNALMARENRLKKKMYITNLEDQVTCLRDENKKLSSTVENQSRTVEELQKELSYLKSILANSDSIGKLIRAIHTCTGMPLASSIEQKPMVNSSERSSAKKDVVPEVKQSKAKGFNTTFDITRHPWEETNLNKPFLPNSTADLNDSFVNYYQTPESTESCCGSPPSPEFEELKNDGLLLDMDIPIELEIVEERSLDSPMVPAEAPSYTNLTKAKAVKTEGLEIKEEDDVGVCLHVSRNKVSLEFCPTCSEKATQNWKAK